VKAYDLAAEVREKVHGHRGFPIDPAQIAGKLGINVVKIELPDGVSGALLKDKNEEPIILLNRDDVFQRQRFTCAHEIGHYIDRIESTDESVDDKEYEYIDFRDGSSSTGDQEKEIFANKFAAELLMPKKEVHRLAESGDSHFEMMWHFDVSASAIKNRLKVLGLLK